ncbi:hypothetical protein BH24ACI3_BH24ACI3_01240 [soil metagenome]
MFTKKVFLALFMAAFTTMATFAQADQKQIRSDEASVAGNDRYPPNPTGSWMGVVTSEGGGPPPFRVLMNFTKDGGFTGSGDGDNSVGSVQYGVWERVGGENSRQFAVTFFQLYYAPDATPTGSGKIRQTVILSKSGDTWQGPAQVDIYAPDGTLVFSGTATATATRIRSEPLP